MSFLLLMVGALMLGAGGGLILGLSTIWLMSLYPPLWDWYIGNPKK